MEKRPPIKFTGIHVANAKNGTVSNNNVRSDHIGIDAQNTTNMTISGNDVAPSTPEREPSRGILTNFWVQVAAGLAVAAILGAIGYLFFS